MVKVHFSCFGLTFLSPKQLKLSVEHFFTILSKRFRYKKITLNGKRKMGSPGEKPHRPGNPGDNFCHVLRINSYMRTKRLRYFLYLLLVGCYGLKWQICKNFSIPARDPHGLRFGNFDILDILPISKVWLQNVTEREEFL